jgi:hypothetical protein
MDRNENPGMVEREMDETPVEREGTSERGMGTDRDSMHGAGRSVEREDMGGGGMDRQNVHEGAVERDGVQGSEVERDAMQGSEREGMMPATSADGATSDTMMRAEQREGGYGYDRPADMAPTRDMQHGDMGRMEGSPRRDDSSGMEGSPRRDDSSEMEGSSRQGGMIDRESREDLGTDRTRGTGDLNNMGRDW